MLQERATARGVRVTLTANQKLPELTLTRTTDFGNGKEAAWMAGVGWHLGIGLDLRIIIDSETPSQSGGDSSEIFGERVTGHGAT